MAVLRCPVTGGPLRFVPSEMTPFPPENFPEGALATEDGSRFYPVRNGFPVLVADECRTAEASREVRAPE